MKVEQIGGLACNTGRRSCFYQLLEDGHWNVTDEVLKQPDAIYANKT
jgi:phosphoribosyl-AMP cyclohydrolase